MYSLGTDPHDLCSLRNNWTLWNLSAGRYRGGHKLWGVPRVVDRSSGVAVIKYRDTFPSGNTKYGGQRHCVEVPLAFGRGTFAPRKKNLVTEAQLGRDSSDEVGRVTTRMLTMDSCDSVASQAREVISLLWDKPGLC